MKVEEEKECLVMTSNKDKRHPQITDMSRFHFLSQRGAFVQMSIDTPTGFSPRRYWRGGVWVRHGDLQVSTI